MVISPAARICAATAIALAGVWVLSPSSHVAPSATPPQMGTPLTAMPTIAAGADSQRRATQVTIAAAERSVASPSPTPHRSREQYYEATRDYSSR